MSRLDRVLKDLCLFKTRTQANHACKEGRVLVDGTPARPSQSLHVGQRILIRDRLGLRETEVEILRVPDGQIARKEVASYALITVRRESSAL